MSTAHLASLIDRDRRPCLPGVYSTIGLEPMRLLLEVLRCMPSVCHQTGKCTAQWHVNEKLSYCCMGDRATRKHAKDIAEMDVEMTT